MRACHHASFIPSYGVMRITYGMCVRFLWPCRRRVVLLCTFVLLCSKSPLACTHIVKGEILHTYPHRRLRPWNGRRKTDQLVLHALLLFVCVCLHRGVSESRKLPAIGFVLGYHSAASAGLRTVCKENEFLCGKTRDLFPPDMEGRDACMHVWKFRSLLSLQPIFSQPSKALRLQIMLKGARVRAWNAHFRQVPQRRYCSYLHTTQPQPVQMYTSTKQR